MDEFERLSHSKWECKYHVVFIPKFPRKVLYGERHRGFIGQHFGPEDISFRRSGAMGAMRRPSAITSRTKRKRTSDWINCLRRLAGHLQVAQ
jgi:hypothetical protein